jgi:hypothetical protein
MRGAWHYGRAASWTGHWPAKAFGASPSGKAADFDSAIRRFESSRPSQQVFDLIEFSGLCCTSIWQQKQGLESPTKVLN